MLAAGRDIRVISAHLQPNQWGERALSDNGSIGAPRRAAQEYDHGPVSGVLPVLEDAPDQLEPPPTPTSLPIGPRSVVPAGGRRGTDIGDSSRMDRLLETAAVSSNSRGWSRPALYTRTPARTIRNM